MGKKLILATKYFTVGPALHTHAQRTSGIHADCVQTYTYTYTHQIRAFFSIAGPRRPRCKLAGYNDHNGRGRRRLTTNTKTLTMTMKNIKRSFHEKRMRILYHKSAVLHRGINVSQPNDSIIVPEHACLLYNCGFISRASSCKTQRDASTTGRG